MPVCSHLLCCITLGAAAIIGAAGCGTPCKNLADQICSCQPTEIDQQSCQRLVDEEAARRTPSEDDETRCDAIIECGNCTCDRLAVGELRACGLALPVLTDAECEAGRQADEEEANAASSQSQP